MKHGTSTMVAACALGLALSAWACGGNSGNANDTAASNPTGQPAAAGADRAGTPATAGAADANGTARPAGTSGVGADTAAKAEPISLTGCLQKGSGTLRSDYVLTEANTARTPVGTSGAASNPKSDVVGKEQMRAAEHSYRLDGDRDELDKLVGKQVRVSGTVEKRSDLTDHNADGTVKDRDRTKIDDGDLAQVKVDTVASIADACGGKTRRTKK